MALLDDAWLFSTIGRIYEAPGDPDAWGQMLPAIARGLGAEHAHLGVYDSRLAVPVDFVTSREGGEEYVRDYARFDTRIHRALLRPERTPLTQLDVMTAEELRRCPLHQEFYPRFEIGHTLFSRSALAHGASYISGFQRTVRRGAYGPDEYRLMALLHPHLERAMRLHLAILEARTRAASYEAGLDALMTPLLLLDSSGRVLFANASARRILDGGEGPALRQGRLTARTASDNARLQAVIATALRRAKGGGVALERPQGGPLVLRVLPAHTALRIPAPRAAAVVLVHEPGAPPEIELEVLMLIGLTHAQARLAQALARGDSLAAYAVKAGLSEQTTRSMLRDIFSKTDTHRQGQLVALLRNLTAP